MNGPRVAYAGMTHLGLCSAIAAASKGFCTIGFDPDQTLTGRLAAGILPVTEPGLADLLRDSRRQITFGADPVEIGRCDLIYVASDVPTDETGRSDLTLLDALLDRVLAHARADAVVVLLSQVPPGYTRARQRPGRNVYYQVETLVFGQAVERALRPERIIVGCSDAARSLPPVLESFLKAFACPILPMRLESAELAKISINCCLAASVAVANTLAELCGHIGADWTEIAPALRLDRRIGMHAYLTPGLGLAGGNIERDLATIMRLSMQHGTKADVIRAVAADSIFRKDWALRVLHESLLSKATDARLGILGLAYKENTASIKHSPSLALITHLAPWPIRVFDPAVMASAAGHPAVTPAHSALDAAQGVDALAIMTPWPEFRGLDAHDIAAAMRGRLVLDPYRVLDAAQATAANLDYRTLGVGC